MERARCGVYAFLNAGARWRCFPGAEVMRDVWLHSA